MDALIMDVMVWLVCFSKTNYIVENEYASSWDFQ